jgi:NDP-sugar pyrophosphorylase family protein
MGRAAIPGVAAGLCLIRLSPGKCSIADARPRPLKNQLSFVPQVRSFDFDDLIASLASLSEKVHIEPHHGYWMDIGRQDDNETVVVYCEANPQKFE